MPKIFHEDDDPDWVSLSEAVLAPDNAAALEERDALWARAERAAARQAGKSTRSDVIERKYVARLEDPKREPSLYETIYGCARVSRADAVALEGVEKRKQPTMHLHAWRRPGHRFVAPRRRVRLNNPD